MINISFHTDSAAKVGLREYYMNNGLIRQNLCWTGTGTDTMPKYRTRFKFPHKLQYEGLA